jgi:hypothetical protein
MIVDKVRAAASKKILYAHHALVQMARLDRMITPSEVRMVIEHGIIVEDYPNDKRGHSCLLLGHGDGGRPIHVVCSPREDYLAIITAYLPSVFEWNGEFNMRRKS